MNYKTRNQILTILFLGVLMGALDIAIVAPALPAIQRYFGVGDRLLAWTFTVYVLFNLIGTPFMAKLSDVYGRRNLYVADVALFGLGSLIVCLTPAQAFWGLLLGRGLQGLGAGGIFPVASAVIGDTFPAEKRGRALGLIGAVFGVAFIIGPILGGVILTFTSWQWLFVINLPIAVVVAVVSWRLLPSQRCETRAPFDWAGMLSLGILLSAFAYGLNQIDTSHFVQSVLSLNVWPFFLVGAALLVAFIRIENQATDPILCISLLKTRQASLASALAAGAGIGEISLVFLPSLAVAAMPAIVDKHTASYLLMPVVLAMAVGSPFVGRLLDRLGSKLVVMGGTALLAVGAIMLSSLSTVLGLFIAAGVVIGLGLSALLGAPIRYIMLNEAPASERASAQGAVAIFTSIGQLISSAFIGAVAASAGGGVSGYSAAYLTIGILAAALLVLSLGLKGRQSEQHAAEANTATAS